MVRDYLEDMLREFQSTVLKTMERIPNEVDRFIYFLAWLNTKLEERGLGRIVIVRGFTVEFYTRASMRTIDVDIVVLGGSEATRTITEFLELLGSVRDGRVYVITPLRYLLSKAIDIVSDDVSRKRLITIKVNNYKVYMQSPEDTLIYVLNAWKWWGSGEDELRARVLAEVLRGKLDLRYLCLRATEEGVLDKLKEVGVSCREVM